MNAALHAEELDSLSRTDLEQLRAGNLEYFPDYKFAELWGCEDAPTDEMRRALLTRYSAIARALAVLDELVPLLDGALRPLTPQGEADIEKVIDAAG